MSELIFDESLELAVFRVGLYQTGPLVPLPEDRPIILSKCMDERPSLATSKNTLWKIGNVLHQGDSTYCRIGKITTHKRSVINEGGDFIDKDEIDAPYSHIFLIRSLGVFAISKNYKLAANSKIVAERYIRLLQSTEYSISNSFDVKLNELSESKEFFQRLMEAESVSRLWVQFNKPNPFDPEGDFYKPVVNSLLMLNGDTVTSEWIGKNLNATLEPARQIVRTAAVTGGNAGATIREGGRNRSKRIRLKRGLITLYTDAKDSFLRVIERMRSRYEQLKKDED